MPIPAGVLWLARFDTGGEFLIANLTECDGGKGPLGARFAASRPEKPAMPPDVKCCGVECRVANAVMAVRAANALPADTEGVSELLDAVLDRLHEVLHEVQDGKYVPSMIDARVALEFARESADAGCLASELAPLILVGIAEIRERMTGERPASGSVEVGWSTRVNPRAH